MSYLFQIILGLFRKTFYGKLYSLILFNAKATLDQRGEIIPYHSQCTNEFSQEVMLVELRGTLVFIEHGKAKLLDLLKVVVHLKLHSKHWVQVVHSCFSAAELQPKTQGEGKKKS